MGSTTTTRPAPYPLTFEIEQAEEPVAVEAGANPQALARRAGVSRHLPPT
ncbi:MAG TPA: hypothetical protein VL485_14310 [Ktedonobacteraceae bacterium]|nr:hypothetical protein [Ktedonobacteraceae bacterium]